MNSQTLREARKYEEASEKMIAKEERPGYHLSARTGWMNDPNGFSYYNGKYHMFYQYYPYDTAWGSMHWGHAVSEDLLHWEYLPVAIAPDEPYDRDGCFSGSALTLPDGRHLLMYTSVLRERLKTGGETDVQTQSLAVGDGIDYEKYEKNPVLDESDLPEGGSRVDFRDPKMWQNPNGTYSCICGNRAADGSGQILLFTSENGFDWKYKSVLAANKNRFGKMWECPDFFKLDGKWVLITSPQDMLPEGFEYHNGNGTLCLIGGFDATAGIFTEECDQTLDYGIDFYAPQTLLAPDGRRIMIGWMQNWDTCNMKSSEMGWFGQMSLPRELSLRNGRIYQWPVRELDALRKNKVEYHDVTISDWRKLDGISGRRVDIEMTVRPEDQEHVYRKFVFRFAENKQYHTELTFRPEEAVLQIDRKFCGSRRAIIHQRRILVRGGGEELKMRIILDRFSVEVFLNDGEQAASAVLYTEQCADGISFLAADGNVKLDIVKYDLI